ncbi:MAG TPA: DEAD/DEAH box helicase [archaeon]|nr:DEAD/DEAH box helicase [archaeon]
MTTTSIKFQPDLQKAFSDLGFTEFTEIQEKSIPLIQQGKDVIGQSYTGSGKTAAFGFPSLEKIVHGHGIQMLILVPTRELCNQVTREMQKFAKYKKVNVVEVYGGVSINPQIEMLPQADVVVGTPGRLLDHMERRTIHLSKVKILVLDEADKMFDMGFIDDVKKIISHTPKERQTLLFSATMSDSVIEIVHRYMHSPAMVKVQTHVDKGQLDQHYYDIDTKDKFSLLVHILKHERHGPALIFCATRRMVDVLDRNLRNQNVHAQGLHGGLSQARRKQVMDAFSAHKLDVLIASDVAARGIDIKDIELVVNYDLPKTSKEYVHRIGRTARAGSKGKVVSLLTPQDYENFSRVLEDRSLAVEKAQIPKFERVPFMMRSHSYQQSGYNQTRSRHSDRGSDRGNYRGRRRY